MTLKAIKVEKAIRSRKVVKSLRCHLTQDEQRIMGLSLAQTIHEIEDAESAKKRATEQAKEKIEELDMRASGLSLKLRDGSEYRPVECDEIYDYTTGSVRIKRKDTGEIVDERAMTQEERQMTFMTDDDGAEKPLSHT